MASLRDNLFDNNELLSPGIKLPTVDITPDIGISSNESPDIRQILNIRNSLINQSLLFPGKRMLPNGVLLDETATPTPSLSGGKLGESSAEPFVFISGNTGGEKKTTALGTTWMFARRSLLPTIAGVIGGAALTAALPMGAPLWLSLAAGLAGGVSAGIAAEKLQEKIAPLSEEEKQELSTAAEEHPFAARVGEVAPNLLFFGVRSPIKVAKTLSTLSKLEQAGVKNIPQVGKALAAEAGIGAGMGLTTTVGIPMLRNLTAKDESEKIPITGSDVALGIATGALLTRPRYVTRQTMKYIGRGVESAIGKLYEPPQEITQRINELQNQEKELLTEQNKILLAMSERRAATGNNVEGDSAYEGLRGAAQKIKDKIDKITEELNNLRNQIKTPVGELIGIDYNDVDAIYSKLNKPLRAPMPTRKVTEFDEMNLAIVHPDTMFETEIRGASGEAFNNLISELNRISEKLGQYYPSTEVPPFKYEYNRENNKLTVKANAGVFLELALGSSIYKEYKDAIRKALSPLMIIGSWEKDIVAGDLISALRQTGVYIDQGAAENIKKLIETSGRDVQGADFLAKLSYLDSIIDSNVLLPIKNGLINLKDIFAFGKIASIHNEIIHSEDVNAVANKVTAQTFINNAQLINNIDNSVIKNAALDLLRKAYLHTRDKNTIGVPAKQLVESILFPDTTTDGHGIGGIINDTSAARQEDGTIVVGSGVSSYLLNISHDLASLYAKNVAEKIGKPRSRISNQELINFIEKGINGEIEGWTPEQTIEIIKAAIVYDRTAKTANIRKPDRARLLRRIAEVVKSYEGVSDVLKYISTVNSASDYYNEFLSYATTSSFLPDDINPDTIRNFIKDDSVREFFNNITRESGERASNNRISEFLNDPSKTKELLPALLYYDTIKTYINNLRELGDTRAIKTYFVTNPDIERFGPPDIRINRINYSNNGNQGQYFGVFSIKSGAGDLIDTSSVFDNQEIRFSIKKINEKAAIRSSLEKQLYHLTTLKNNLLNSKSANKDVLKIIDDYIEEHTNSIKVLSSKIGRLSEFILSSLPIELLRIRYAYYRSNRGEGAFDDEKVIANIIALADNIIRGKKAEAGILDFTPRALNEFIKFYNKRISESPVRYFNDWHQREILSIKVSDLSLFAPKLSGLLRKELIELRNYKKKDIELLANAISDSIESYIWLINGPKGGRTLTLDLGTLTRGFQRRRVTDGSPISEFNVQQHKFSNAKPKVSYKTSIAPSVAVGKIIEGILKKNMQSKNRVIIEYKHNNGMPAYILATREIVKSGDKETVRYIGIDGRQLNLSSLPEARVINSLDGTIVAGYDNGSLIGINKDIVFNSPATGNIRNMVYDSNIFRLPSGDSNEMQAISRGLLQLKPFRMQKITIVTPKEIELLHEIYDRGLLKSRVTGNEIKEVNPASITPDLLSVGIRNSDFSEGVLQDIAYRIGADVLIAGAGDGHINLYVKDPAIAKGVTQPPKEEEVIAASSIKPKSKEVATEKTTIKSLSDIITRHTKTFARGLSESINEYYNRLFSDDIGDALRTPGDAILHGIFSSIGALPRTLSKPLKEYITTGGIKVSSDTIETDVNRFTETKLEDIYDRESGAYLFSSLTPAGGQNLRYAVRLLGFNNGIANKEYVNAKKAEIQRIADSILRVAGNDSSARTVINGIKALAEENVIAAEGYLSILANGEPISIKALTSQYYQFLKNFAEERGLKLLFVLDERGDKGLAYGDHTVLLNLISGQNAAFHELGHTLIYNLENRGDAIEKKIVKEAKEKARAINNLDQLRERTELSRYIEFLRETYEANRLWEEEVIVDNIAMMMLKRQYKPTTYELGEDVAAYKRIMAGKGDFLDYIRVLTRKLMSDNYKTSPNRTDIVNARITGYTPFSIDSFHLLGALKALSDVYAPNEKNESIKHFSSLLFVGKVRDLVRRGLEEVGYTASLDYIASYSGGLYSPQHAPTPTTLYTPVRGIYGLVADLLTWEKRNLQADTILATIKARSLLDDIAANFGLWGRYLAERAHSFFEYRDMFIGRFQTPALLALRHLKETQKAKLLEILRTERDTGTPGDVPEDLKYAYEFIRELIRSIAEHHEAFGIPIREYKGGKETLRKMNRYDFYFPDIISTKVLDKILRFPESAEAKSLCQDFIEYTSDKILDEWTKDTDTEPTQEQEEKAVKIAQERLQNILRSSASGQRLARGITGEYGPLRVEMGIGLPESWRVKDLDEIIQRYTMRVAHDMALHNTIQVDPLARIILGIGTDPWGKRVTKEDIKDKIKAIESFKDIYDGESTTNKPDIVKKRDTLVQFYNGLSEEVRNLVFTRSEEEGIIHSSTADLNDPEAKEFVESVFRKTKNRVLMLNRVNDALDTIKEINSQDVQSLMRFLYRDITHSEATFHAATSFVKSLIIGVKTKVRDIFNSVALMAGYAGDIPIKNFPQAVLSTAKFLADGNAFRVAVQNGFVRVGSTSLQEWTHLFGENQGDFAKVLLSLRDLALRVTKTEDLEQYARLLSMAMALSAVNIHIVNARNGTGRTKVNAIKFLEYYSEQPFNPHKPYTPEEIEMMATRLAQQVQGTYDARDLPSWLLEHSFTSATFTLAKWSISQTNRLLKAAAGLKAANVWRMLLGSFIGGLFGKYLLEVLFGRKRADATYGEIISALKEKKDALGKLGLGDLYQAAQENIYTTTAILQWSGFAGIMLDVIYTAMSAMRGKTSGSYGAPLYSQIVSLLDSTMGAISAIDDGENPIVVSSMLLSDIIKSQIQTLNALTSFVAMQEEEFAPETRRRIEQANLMRDYETYRRIVGYPTTPSFGAKGYYENLAIQRFKRAKNLSDVYDTFMPALESSLSRAVYPEDVSRRISALTRDNIRYMPTMTGERGNISPDFVRYYNYIRRAYGDKAAEELLNRYVRDKMLQQQRHNLIRSIAGGSLMTGLD